MHSPTLANFKSLVSHCFLCFGPSIAFTSGLFSTTLTPSVAFATVCSLFSILASPNHHDSSTAPVIWQDNIDPDNMTSEELLDLGDAVGTQSRDSNSFFDLPFPSKASQNYKHQLYETLFQYSCRPTQELYIPLFLTVKVAILPSIAYKHASPKSEIFGVKFSPRRML
ncbi:hypothetical protein K1719_044288 [Acacia pycnantha]|nr:hypothetical protein K1719_044288 [Acacia pycnantha]